MTNKEAVLEVIDNLPEDVSLEQISEEIAIMAAIRRGDEAVDAGKVLSHEEVEKRFSSWFTK